MTNAPVQQGGGGQAQPQPQPGNVQPPPPATGHPAYENGPTVDATKADALLAKGTGNGVPSRPEFEGVTWVAADGSGNGVPMIE